MNPLHKIDLDDSTCKALYASMEAIVVKEEKRESIQIFLERAVLGTFLGVYLLVALSWPIKCDRKVFL